MSRGRLAALLLLLVPILFASGAEASVKSRKLRAEVTELKSRIGQLEGRLAYLARLQEGRGAGRADGTTPGRLPGPGGVCADPCASDADGDGVNDCEDPCPCEPDAADGDGDGWPDCADPCPDDAANECLNPCRNDSDGDGRGDCGDPCPFDPAEAKDRDGDALPDCVDPCPDDRKNGCFEPCPLDSDGDGVRDCDDVCPWRAGDDPTRPCGIPPWTPMPDPPPGASDGCVIGGCSSQLCGDRGDDLVSTCEWRPEYACYRSATCARQADGKCGWTMTPALQECLEKGGGRPVAERPGPRR